MLSWIFLSFWLVVNYDLLEESCIDLSNKISRLQSGVCLQWKISEGVKIEVRTLVTFSWVVFFVFTPFWDNHRSIAEQRHCYVESIYLTIILSLTIFTFDNVEAAQRALATLNGQDIYAGCCTLKIDYSKVISFELWVLLGFFTFQCTSVIGYRIQI